MKILYVTTLSVTIRSFFIPQLQYLSRHGFDVVVACSPDVKLASELGTGIRFVPIRIPRGLSPFGMLQTIGKLYWFFKNEKFDLIQYSTPNAAFCSALAGWFVGCGIRNYHLMGFRYLGAAGAWKWVLKQLERLTCFFSTSIECVSVSNLNFGVSENFFSRQKSAVVWNGSSGGVDLKKFDFSKRDEWRDAIRAELGYGKEDFVFGFAGRITKDKGVDEIFLAFRKLRKHAKLLLIGSAEGLNTIQPALLEEARRNPDITFHKSVRDIERYFAAMDVLLLPSYREGFGNVIIEAAAVGTPGIVSNIPGPVDAVAEQKTALIVPVRDSNALFTAMNKVIDSRLFNSKQGAEVAATHFYSEKLNRKIMKRKLALLHIDNMIL